MITDPIQTSRALLTWQRPLEQLSPGQGTSRQRYAVAELVALGAGLGFSYKSDLDPDNNLDSARGAGFRGYPGLALDVEHAPSKSTDVLKRRLPPDYRPDFNEFKERFGLSPAADFSLLSLLAYTGARLTSDSFGISETFDGFDHPFRYVFDIAGFRRYWQNAPDLDIGEALVFRHEPSNKYDCNAVEVVRKTGIRVGYVNRMQAPAVLRWLEHGNIESCVFRINGRSLYPRLFVMADIEPNCQWATPQGARLTAL